MGTETVLQLGDIRRAGLAQAERIAAMVQGLDDLDIKIPRSDWTVAEAAAHLAFTTLGLAMMTRGLAIPYGDGTREGLAEANAWSLEGFSERDGAELARQIVEHTRMVFDEAAVQPPDRICPTPMGEVPVDGLIGYVLTHQAMHGSAIATALDAPPPFAAEDLEGMWPFLHHVLPRVLVPSAVGGLTAGIELAFGEAFGLVLTFDQGELSVERSSTRPPDCRISGDAHTMFLVLVKILDLEEELAQGSVQASGPKADLARRVAGFFNIP